MRGGAEIYANNAARLRAFTERFKELVKIEIARQLESEPNKKQRPLEESVNDNVTSTLFFLHSEISRTYADTIVKALVDEAIKARQSGWFSSFGF